MPLTTDWDALLLAYLHDPPDKALSVRGHESRAGHLKDIATDGSVSNKAMKRAVGGADQAASIIERLAMPKAVGATGERAVGPKDGHLIVIHPMSKERVSLAVPELDDSVLAGQRDELRAVIADLPGEGEAQARNRFFAIWRLWPDALSQHVHRSFARLPADTRTPDHTLWHHLDIATGFKAADAEGQGAALLAFALGPVQRFIDAARSVRDLWSGSMILSWLAFRAMLPIVAQLGPTALVYPALRGNPLLDLWLGDPRRLGDKAPQPDVDLRLTPALPHRFLALVPWGKDGASAKDLAAQCQAAATDAWKEIGKAIQQRINKPLMELCPAWQKRWDRQIGSYFSGSTAVTPLAGSGEEVDRRLATLLTGQGSFADAFPHAEAVRKLARSIPATDRPGYTQDHAGRWQYQVELVSRSLASQRTIRYVPANEIPSNFEERVPQKCTLLGSFEQMGRDELRQSKDFWDKVAQDGISVGGVRVRKGEALCAVAMVKRFAAPAFLTDSLCLTMDDLRFSDTWTIARAAWLEEVGIDPKEIRKQHGDWNGQWLHWNTKQDDLDEPPCPPPVLARIKQAREQYGQPPVYYAILRLDGDDLGGWLRGEKSPKVRDIIHPDLVRYYEGLGPAPKAGLDANRPVGPALHAAISTALSNFALHIVPKVVKQHHGTVIYSGGDDTLVLLPVSRALACAIMLRNAYMSDWYTNKGREYQLMGSKATLSGGLVLVHAKDDLRLALRDARHAEKKAKELGKDALCISRAREHKSTLCPWEFADDVNKWVTAFLRDDDQQAASDRWAYHLLAEEATLRGLEPDAIKSEIGRQVNRAETSTRRRLGEPEKSKEGERAGDILSAQFEKYRVLVMNSVRGLGLSQTLSNFLTLIRNASFLARGRDR